MKEHFNLCQACIYHQKKTIDLARELHVVFDNPTRGSSLRMMGILSELSDRAFDERYEYYAIVCDTIKRYTASGEFENCVLLRDFQKFYMKELLQ